MLYDFKCKKCDAKYEAFADYDKTGKYPKVKCAKCGSKSKEKLVSSFNFSFSDPVGTDRYEGSHDYRFHHKQKDVRQERENAQNASHMGKNPYKESLDDLNKGDLFGDVQ